MKAIVNILFIIKVEILVLIKVVVETPPLPPKKESYANPNCAQNNHLIVSKHAVLQSL